MLSIFFGEELRLTLDLLILVFEVIESVLFCFFVGYFEGDIAPTRIRPGDLGASLLIFD